MSGNKRHPVRYAVRFQVRADSLTWLVIREGEILRRYCRKHDAICRASGLARTEPAAELVIERMDGTVQAKRRYGPGAATGRGPESAPPGAGSTV